MACSELAKPTYEGLQGLSPTNMPQRQLFDIVCRTHMCPSYTSYGVGYYSDLVMLGPYLPPHRWWQPTVLMVMERGYFRTWKGFWRFYFAFIYVCETLHLDRSQGNTLYMHALILKWTLVRLQQKKFYIYFTIITTTLIVLNYNKSYFYKIYFIIYPC
jgi:hypothetical protein